MPSPYASCVCQAPDQCLCRSLRFRASPCRHVYLSQAPHNCCRQHSLPLPLLQVQTRLEVEVRGGKALRLPIHGDAVLPAVDIKEAELAFGDVYTGVTVRRSLTVINTSPVPASECCNEDEIAEGQACLCGCVCGVCNQAHVHCCQTHPVPTTAARSFSPTCGGLPRSCLVGMLAQESAPSYAYCHAHLLCAKQIELCVDACPASSEQAVVHSHHLSDIEALGCIKSSYSSAPG